MGLVSVLGGMGLLDDSIVCASISLLAPRSTSAPPHHNTDFQWLGRALLFFLQLEVLLLLMPHLALAILAPFAFGTVSSPIATLITTSASVRQAFDLPHEAL